MGNDQEVEFHEIEIGDRIILPVFMRSNYFASFHEIEIEISHEIEFLT